MTLRKRDKEKAEKNKQVGDEEIEVEMDTGMHKGGMFYFPFVTLENILY